MNLPPLPIASSFDDEYGSYTDYQMTEYGQACYEQGVSSVHTQEPAAYTTPEEIAFLKDDVRASATMFNFKEPDGVFIPLYTAPQPAEPLELSEDEIDALWKNEPLTVPQIAVRRKLVNVALAAANAKRKPT